MNYKLSLIVPCYNEENNIFLFYNAVRSSLQSRVETYELIFVNDGSHDQTRAELYKLYKQDTDRVKVIGFSRNFGKESAIYAGLSYASGEYTCIIDADLQQDPKVLLEMMDILDHSPEVDCVAAYQAQRIEGKVLSFFKRQFYKIINIVTDIELIPGASDFRLFRSNIRTALLSIKEYYRFSKGIFSWVGFTTVPIPYQVHERASGSTKWSFRKLFRYAWDGIISYSTVPLKAATWVGFLSSAAAILYMCVIIFQKLMLGIAVPGYATIVVLILLLGGIQLLFMGIIGEYLSKVYIQGKQRPIYIAKDYWGIPESDKDEI